MSTNIIIVLMYNSHKLLGLILIFFWTLPRSKIGLDTAIFPEGLRKTTTEINQVEIRKEHLQNSHPKGYRLRQFARQDGLSCRSGVRLESHGTELFNEST
jgi:hypothetical protein